MRRHFKWHSGTHVRPERKQVTEERRAGRQSLLGGWEREGQVGQHLDSAPGVTGPGDTVQTVSRGPCSSQPRRQPVRTCPVCRAQQAPLCFQHWLCLFWRLCLSNVAGICFVRVSILFLFGRQWSCLWHPWFLLFPSSRESWHTHSMFTSRFAYCSQASVFKSHVSTLRYSLLTGRARGAVPDQLCTEWHFLQLAGEAGLGREPASDWGSPPSGAILTARA